MSQWRPALALVLVFALCLIIAPLVAQQARANSYVETAVSTHRNFLSGNLPLEIHTESPAVVTAWFAGKVPFRFQLPAFQPELTGEPIYRLTGARLVNFKGQYAALVTYDLQGKAISLLAISSDAARAWGGDEIQSAGITFHYLNEENLKVITWTNHGLTYALVSSFPGAAKQSCLVCHQSLENRNTFSPKP